MAFICSLNMIRLISNSLLFIFSDPPWKRCGGGRTALRLCCPTNVGTECTHYCTHMNSSYVMCHVLKLFSGWSDGMAVFRHFLRSEFSEENLDFWLAVDKYKKTRTLNKMATRAHSIFNEFISTSASRQVLLSVHMFLCPRECPAFCPSLVWPSPLSPTGQCGFICQGGDQSEPASGSWPRLLPAGTGTDIQLDGKWQLSTISQVPPLLSAGQPEASTCTNGLPEWERIYQVLQRDRSHVSGQPIRAKDTDMSTVVMNYLPKT